MDITVQGRAITPSFCFTLLLLISTGGRDANPTSYCCIMKCKHWSIGESNYPKLQSYSTINLNLNITANQCLYERGSCTNLKSCWNHLKTTFPINDGWYMLKSLCKQIRNSCHLQRIKSLVGPKGDKSFCPPLLPPSASPRGEREQRGGNFEKEK